MRSEQSTIPKMTKGLSAFWKSLNVKSPKPNLLANEPLWNDDFLLDEFSTSRTLVRGMDKFGYTSKTIRSYENHDDNLGFIGPLSILTSDGVRALRETCEKLADRAPQTEHIVSKRLRFAQGHSRLIDNFVRSDKFLTKMSRLAAVPLILHPHQDAAVQINYYYAPVAPTEKPHLTRWHTDGMDYVFTLLLTAEESYSGGAFHFFNGTKDEFNDAALDNGKVEKADFLRAGEAIFSRGSNIYHGVTPVTRGYRITLVVSMFCPYFSGSDSNRFWHSAPDDGLLRTARNWARFRMPWIKPETYVARSGCNPPTWESLK